METKNVYMWGAVKGQTIDSPAIETLEHFLTRKNLADEAAAKAYLDNYAANLNALLKFFIGTQTEFETYKANKPFKDKADKGQEVENAIELNKLVAGYMEKRIMYFETKIIEALRTLTVNSQDITAVANYNTYKTQRDTHIIWLDNVNQFEVDLSIATNSDTSHPIDWLHQQDFVEALEQISNNDKTRWTRITKLLKVEETYEPAAVAAEYEKIQKAIHDYLHPTTTTSAIVNHVVDGGIT